MWAHAIDLMDQAERMHRQFFRLASSSQAQASWEPPVDVFEDENEVVIVVAMPGIPDERVEVRLENDGLLVRGQRQIPVSGQHAVRHLEIPYGTFERRIALPTASFESVSRESAHGCLVVRLRKAHR